MVSRATIFALFSAFLGLVIIGCSAIGGQQASRPTVIITSPPSGSVYNTGEEVVVQSTSTDPAGVTRVALIVDGVVVRDAPSPVAQGQPQFSLIQSWVAETTGQHTLTVRATNAQNASADTGIFISVKEPTGLEPTAIIAIATAVPLSTATDTPVPLPPATPTITPDQSNPPITVVVTATPVPSTDTPTATLPPPCADNSKFVADLTIPDGTIFTPNAVFTKSWRVQNNGSCTWGNYELVFVSGAQMAAGGIFPVPNTAPGATADLVVPMSAPPNYGQYAGTWRLRNVNGQLFGTNLTVVINVPAPATPTPTPPPTVAGCQGQPNDFTFSVNDDNITPGQNVTLSWSFVQNASDVRLDGGQFNNQGVETPGQRNVAPNTTTEYKLKAFCNNSGESREKSVTVTVTQPVGDFSGQWDHNFGTMTLTQNGNTVTGTYKNDYDGGVGAIAGTVSGNVLTGTYQKNQIGPIEFTLSANGKQYTGNWSGTNQWCGARPGESFPSNCAFDGNWNTKYGAGETPCNMVLDQVGTSVTGKYCNNTRTISGTISYTSGFVVLSGTWKISNVQTGPFVFYLPIYSSQQFQGNYSGNAWCGWRNGQAAPSPCVKN